LSELRRRRAISGNQAKIISPKQMPWEPSKIKDFNEVLERNEYH
jgi:hypothetical protein